MIQTVGKHIRQNVKNITQKTRRRNKKNIEVNLKCYENKDSKCVEVKQKSCKQFFSISLDFDLSDLKNFN